MTQIKVLLIEDDPMVQEVNKEFIKSVPTFKLRQSQVMGSRASS